MRKSDLDVAFVIPAYEPTTALLEVVEGIRGSDVGRILIVDDGSGPEFRPLFDKLARMEGVDVARHAINLGKGAALKTGINVALLSHPNCVGIVTADADGQHLPLDIIAVADELRAMPDALVLGVRSFGSDVPFRSRLGNLTTRHLLRLVLGPKLADTQTGLRGIPASFAKLVLRIPTSGYDFELDMIVRAKHHDLLVREIRIQTVYEDGNPTSHFRPLFDSMKIYFVLFRFGVLAALTAIVDNLVFYAVFLSSESILVSQGMGRLIALAFNYIAARNVVFLSRQRHETVLPKYVALVVISGLCSYLLIKGILSILEIGVLAAKVLAELTLFFANFAILRDFVFREGGPKQSTSTDWTAYYRATPPTAKLSRRYTTSRLIRLLRQCIGRGRGVLVELGGANSCFLDAIAAEIRPDKYHVVDSNRYGLDLLEQRGSGSGELVAHEADATDLHLEIEADVSFSVGLIEHFSVPVTKRVIDAHFKLVKPGGHIILSFPTPTALYRVARFLAEAIGVWRFPDERPLEIAEVRSRVERHGEVLSQEILWPIVFTQCMMLIRKTPAA